MSTQSLTVWRPEDEFIPLWRGATGYGSKQTFSRWRREGSAPACLEFMKAGRTVLCRSKVEIETPTASPE